MSEAEAIASADQPGTVESLTADLRELGVEPGMTLMVHASLQALGWVVGGAHAVVAALLHAVGPDGTVMMPTHSSDVSDPADWEAPPVPEHWWATIREQMPAYDPRLTSTRSMGAIVECFRHVPGVRRSNHPTVSAAAVGPHANQLISDHRFEFGLGEGSPQAHLYDLDGHILLLGVGHANNTSLHLSEHRAAPTGAPTDTWCSPMNVDGARVWVSHDMLDEDFAAIGAAFAATGAERSGAIGSGLGRLMRARDLVDFGAGWMRDNRPGWNL